MNPANIKIGVLMIDDHPVIRYALANLINAEPDLCCLGEAANLADGCDMVTSLLPDIVILDLEMEDSSGLEALTRLRAIHPQVSTIVYSNYSDEWRIVEAIRSNIQGYLRKDMPTQTLIDAIRLVSEGKTFLDPEITLKVMGQLADTKDPNLQPSDSGSLTHREKAVLRLMAEGKRNKEIAKLLVVSERTVKFHASAIFGKLGVSNRIEAALVARNQGLIPI